MLIHFVMLAGTLMVVLYTVVHLAIATARISSGESMTKIHWHFWVPYVASALCIAATVVLW